jgi:hypothetical protein
MLASKLQLGISFIALLSVCLISGCSKSSSGPTSSEGAWTYTTPDGKIKVTFDLVKTSTGSLDIQNQTMMLNGTTVNAEKTITGITLPSISYIRINANDIKAVYPYDIVFNNGKVSSDFKHIDVPDGTYTYPWGTANTLKSVSIVRP